MARPKRTVHSTQHTLALIALAAAASCSPGDAERAAPSPPAALGKGDAPPAKLNTLPVVYEGSCAGLRSHSGPSQGCALGFLAFSCAPYETVRKDAAGCSSCEDISNWISDPNWNFNTCGTTFTVCVGAAPPHPRCTLAVKRDHSFPPQYFEVSPTVLTALGYVENVHFGYSSPGFTGGFGSFDGAVYAGDVRERVMRASDPMSCGGYAPGTRACDGSTPAHAETLFYCDDQQRWQAFACNGNGHYEYVCSNDSGRGAACCNLVVGLCRDPLTDHGWPLESAPVAPAADSTPPPPVAPPATTPAPGPAARANWERCDAATECQSVVCDCFGKAQKRCLPNAQYVRPCAAGPNWQVCEDDADCDSDYCACWEGAERCLPSRDYAPREGC